MRRALLGLLRLTAALVVALLLAEGAVRLLDLRIPPRAPAEKGNVLQKVPESQVPGLGLMLRPGAHSEVVYPGLGDQPERRVVYRINRLGFRDRPTPQRAQAGTYRIALLGDSVTYGTGVSLEQTLARQLEPRLAARLPGHPIEVLGCGVPATNTGQQVALLKHRVLALEPDMVLIVTTIMDTTGYNIPPVRREESPEANWIMRLGLTSGIFHDEFSSPAERRMIAWRERSVLLDLLAHHLYRALYNRLSLSVHKSSWAPDGPGVASIRTALARGRQLAADHDFQLCVALYPSLVDLSDNYPFRKETEQLREICNGLGLPFFDLLPPLLGQDADTLRAQLHDRHPNGRCNTLEADYLAEQLAPHIERTLSH